MNKKVLKIAAVIFAVLIALLIAFIRFVPAGGIPDVLKNNKTAGKVLCVYPAQVVGSSMEPLLKEGRRAIFNKCFNQNELKVNDVVLFNDRGSKRISTIREVTQARDEIIYKVSQEARINDIMEVNPEQVLAVYKD
ncbi:S26 family signal peptidase [Patescibacteria group bacterium]|nr:S26 family signal peptidase [Patescibacteria group bacterium]